jgi:hypothetical protein
MRINFGDHEGVDQRNSIDEILDVKLYQERAEGRQGAKEKTKRRSQFLLNS